MAIEREIEESAQKGGGGWRHDPERERERERDRDPGNKRSIEAFELVHVIYPQRTKPKTFASCRKEVVQQ